MQQEVILKCMDGSVFEGVLAQEIRPDHDEIEMFVSGDKKNRRIFLFQDVCCILIKGASEEFIPSDSVADIEEVVTVSGERYRLRVPEQIKYKNGFYGLPVHPNGGFDAIFFNRNGVKIRRRNLPIGEMRLAQGDGGVQIGRIDHLTVMEQLAICYAGLAGGDLSGEPEMVGEGTLDIRMTAKILLKAKLTRRSPAFREELRRQARALAESVVRRHEELVTRLAARLSVSDLSVAEVAPTMVPLTLSAELPVVSPSAGEVMVITGLFGSTTTVLVPDIPTLPAPSVALTRTVLLPV